MKRRKKTAKQIARVLALVKRGRAEHRAGRTVQVKSMAELLRKRR